jgi:hypothetical protein
VLHDILVYVCLSITEIDKRREKKEERIEKKEERKKHTTYTRHEYSLNTILKYL